MDTPKLQGLLDRLKETRDALLKELGAEKQHLAEELHQAIESLEAKLGLKGTATAQDNPPPDAPPSGN